MDFVFEYAAAMYSHAVFVREFNCICETASHCICIGGVCHISRWKQSWNKLFCYLRSDLYLVFGYLEVGIWDTKYSVTFTHCKLNEVDIGDVEALG